MVISVLFLLLQLLRRLLLFDKNNDDGDAGGMRLFIVPSMVDFGGICTTGAMTAVTAVVVFIIQVRFTTIFVVLINKNQDVLFCSINKRLR